MNDKEKAVRAAEADRRLEALYPDAACSLEHGRDPFRLLIMAILSAQCTDARVNAVAGPLFERFPDARSIAESAEGELEELIRPVGLFNSKARNIRKCCRTLTERFSGRVPESMEDLLTLGGVGRKVANLIRGDVFGLGGIVADTHCIRISNRLGLVDSVDPLKVERQLSPLIPAERQSDFCHRLVLFGRDCCSARKPGCKNCALADICEYRAENAVSQSKTAERNIS